MMRLASINRKKAFLSTAIAIQFVLTSLLINAANVAAEDTENIFYIGFQESVMTLHPFKIMYEPDNFAISCIYDCLTAVDEDGLLSPNLAESWWCMNGTTAVSLGTDLSKLHHNKPAADWPTGSIWEYNLTENVYWNDGTLFTADDVIWTVDGIYVYTVVLGFCNYFKYTRVIDHIEKINDFKIRIFFAAFDTKKPIPIAWGDSLFFPILPHHMFEGQGASSLLKWNGWPAIGTGPYYPIWSEWNATLSLLMRPESMTLHKSEYYNFTENGTRKGLGAHYNRTLEIDKVVMKFFSEEQTLVLNVRTGSVDATKINPSNYFSILNMTNKPAGLKVVASYGCNAESMISHFNVKEGGTPGGLNPCRLDPAVHRAITLGCNKSEIVNAVYKGLASPGLGILSPAYPEWFWEPSDTEKSYFNVTNGKEGTPDFQVIWGYNKTLKHVMDYDPALANAILDAAGYVWDNSTDPHVRRFGPIAADRLLAMGIIGDNSSVLDWDDPYSGYVGPRPLKFEDVIERELYEEQLISKHIAGNWKDIGILLIEDFVDLETWNAEIYSYEFEFTETHFSGDPDPNYLLYVMTKYSISGWNEWGTENKTYDHYYDMQSKSLSYADRKHWVDECQKWQYLAGSSIVTCYPKNCYAYNDADVPGAYGTWTNWGNWTEHPGLAIDNYWGAAQILFNLRGPTPPPPPQPPYAFILAISGAIIAAVVVVSYLALKQKKQMPPLQNKEGA